MADRVFQIRVENVKTGSRIPVGLTHEPVMGMVSVGRARDNVLQLQDATVSSYHLQIAFESAHGFVVHNLSRKGTTAIDGERLENDVQRTIEREHFFVQAGRVLLSVTLLAETLPVDELFPVPTAPVQPQMRPTPLLRLRQYAHQSEIYCCGHPVSLYPSAARLLGRLCVSPGEVVAHMDLAIAVDPEYFQRSGGTNVPQLVTYVRAMFNQAIDDGHLTIERLRAALRTASDKDADLELLKHADRRALLRILIENERNVGYILHLPAAEIALEQL